MSSERTYLPAEVVDLLRADDAGARELGARVLVDQWGGTLFAYLARTLSLPEADAADVLNAVLYRAIMRIGQLRDTGRLEAWLYRLSYSAAVDWHRRNKRRREVLTEPGMIEAHASPVDPWPSTENAPGTSVRVATIQEALGTLSPRDQAVLSAIAHDLSNEEIAVMLSVTPPHARVLRHRAVERLKRAYAHCASSDTHPEMDPDVISAEATEE